MTNKRFTLKKYTSEDYAILDDGTEIAYASNKSAFTFCELLNELNNENKKLKSLCKVLIKHIEKNSIAFVIDEEVRRLLE